jgi:cell division septation protein DedD
VLKRLTLLPLLLAGCSRNGGDAARAAAYDPSKHPEVREIPAVAFRLPEGGGALGVYTLPTLAATPWGAGSRVVGARTAIGVDLDGRRLLFRDSTGAIAAFDLVSLRQRTVAPRRTTATLAADGALLAVDSGGGVTESQAVFTRQWSSRLGRGVHDVFAAPGARLITVRRAGGHDTLQIASRETGVGLTRLVPDAVGRASSRDGDAVAFATDSGLVVFEGREIDHSWFVRLSGKPRIVVFSPSGHRLYVVLEEKDELAVVDRFGRHQRASIGLPDRATDIRPDPWGRVLLVRGGGRHADETWVVAVASERVEGSIAGPWGSDLPTVAQDGVILARQGSAVVARDLRSLDSLGAVAGGAHDLWFAGRWVPSSAAAAAKADLVAKPAADTRKPPPAAVAAPAPAVPAPGPVAGAQPSATPNSQGQRPAFAKPAGEARPASGAFYVQLIATRSEEAARSLAAQVTSFGARVVPPSPGTGDENWRVVTGPYPTRDSANAVGRAMGRAYYVSDKSREAARP